VKEECPDEVETDHHRNGRRAVRAGQRVDGPEFRLVLDRRLEQRQVVVVVLAERQREQRLLRRVERRQLVQLDPQLVQLLAQLVFVGRQLLERQLGHVERQQLERRLQLGAQLHHRRHEQRRAGVEGGVGCALQQVRLQQRRRERQQRQQLHSEQHEHADQPEWQQQLELQPQQQQRRQLVERRGQQLQPEQQR
jgi:hypothetical protein